MGSEMCIRDSLQGIFDFGKTPGEKKVPWQMVTKTFEEIGTLETPFRWKKSKPALGKWIAQTRTALIKGEEINLEESEESRVYFVKEEGGSNADVLRRLVKKQKGSIAGIFDSRRSRCHAILKNLKNRYSTFEDADAAEVQKSLEEFDCDDGVVQIRILSKFVRAYTAKSGDFGKWCEKLEQGDKIQPRREDFKLITTAIQNVLNHPGEMQCLKVMEALELKKEKLTCLLYTSPSPRDLSTSRMPSSA